MELRQLRDFVAVVDHGTVTAAAEALHLSQPPLSAQIHLLEEELGTPLFDRSTRRMRMTEAGRLLYGRACGVLGQCADLQEEMADFLSGGAGTLRLGTVSSLVNAPVLPLLAAFHQKNPGVRFDLRESNTYALLDAVRTQQVELAFVRRPFSAAELNCVSLGAEALCAAGRPEFLPDASAAGFAALSAVPLLLYRRWESILRDAFLQQEVHPQVLCVSDDARTVLRMAEMGFGVGILPRSALTETAGLRFFPLDRPTLTSEPCAVSRRGVYLTAAARQLLELITSGS